MARRDSCYEYLSPLGIYCRFSIIAAPSPKGTSGGCWVDSSGRVIGNQSGFINDDANNPSGLAIVAPVDAIRSILTKTGHGKAATIGTGLEEVFSQSVGFLKRLPEGARGLLTVPIRKGSTAGAAGLTRETLITHINGTPITYRREFMAIFRKIPPGDKIILRIVTPENHVPRDVEVPTSVVRRST
jgi:serine protease Do/serine protease DegQ